MLSNTNVPDAQEEIMISKTLLFLHAQFSEQNNAAKNFQQLFAHSCF